LSKEAQKVRAMLVVDNTFATPYHQKPLLLGADIVVHSATKGLGGHNDLMAGAIAGAKKHYDNLWFTRQAIGTTLDAYSGSLLERGLKTFELRAEKMALNAMAIAEYLADHPKVSQVRYPGLKNDTGHSVAAKQMQNGFGGVLAFDVGDSQEDAKKFISELKSIYHAVSLGATESLICIPYLTTLLYMPPERRTVFGVCPNTVRFSAGIEKAEILISDLKQALDKLKSKSISRIRIGALQNNVSKKGSSHAKIRI
jgi:cystathionine beta-lyase/cystathionine gamma-synthase